MTVAYDPDAVEELLGAYALDALEDHERDLVDAHLAVNPRFRSEVDQHREAIAFLAEGVLAGDGARPRPDIWQGIENSLQEAPPPLRLVRPTRSSPRLPWTTRVVGAVAAAAVIAVAGLGLRVYQQDDRIDALRAALDGDRLEEAAATAVTIPGAELLTLSAPTGTGIEARITLQPDGIGYLVSDGLPALPPDRAYQLWAIVDDNVISAGVLGPDPGVSPFQVTGNVAGFAITEEVAGGVVASVNDPVAVWLRDA